MHYKAIISDIDGTLVPVKIDAYPSRKVNEAIKKVESLGVTFSVASGRPFELVEYLVKDLALSSPIIVDNGAAIYEPSSGKPLYESIIDIKQANDIAKIILQFSKHFHVSYSSGNQEYVTHIDLGKKVRKLLIPDLSFENAEKCIKTVEAEYKNLHIIRASSNAGKDFIDVYITDSTATKQYAILKLADMLNISTSEIIAIGDHYNDFPLFMACGLKVAMGNAVDDLKAIADYVAPSVENDGIVDVIEKYVLS